MTTLTKTNTCPSRYTGIISPSSPYECGLNAGHGGVHMDKCWPMTWPDHHADPAPVTDPALESIRARLEEDKAQFTDGQYDQSIRDREYLLSLIDAL